jgi:rhamnosyltransferase
MSLIYAVVVAYNPDLDDLLANVTAIKNQVDKVILCNNSTFDIGFKDEKIVEFNFGDNLGIARAQSIGMQWAFENGADFILQMDQDSTPDEHMVSKLHKVFCDLRKTNINVGLVGPVVYDKLEAKANRLQSKKINILEENQFFYVSATLSSGSLISKDAYESVGGMNDSLFIDVVDFEYCWRLRDNGFMVVRCANAQLAHRQGDGSKRIFGLVSVGIPAPIRHYYAFRNTIFLLGSDSAPLYWKVSSVVKLILKFVLYRFIFEDGLNRYKFMKQGIADGVNGKMWRIDGGQ